MIRPGHRRHTHTHTGHRRHAGSTGGPRMCELRGLRLHTHPGGSPKPEPQAQPPPTPHSSLPPEAVYTSKGGGQSQQSWRTRGGQVRAPTSGAPQVLGGAGLRSKQGLAGSLVPSLLWRTVTWQVAAPRQTQVGAGGAMAARATGLTLRKVWCFRRRGVERSPGRWPISRRRPQPGSVLDWAHSDIGLAT
jgi:hypothetical protein